MKVELDEVLRIMGEGGSNSAPVVAAAQPPAMLELETGVLEAQTA